MTDITPTKPSTGTSRLIRQSHRWISVAFVISVLATSIALAQAEPIMWMSYLPLLPLFLLFLTGAYLFVLPYLSRWRHGARG